MDIENIKEDIRLVKERNKNVEADKAWEISKTRRLLIAIMTYSIIVLFLYLINAPRPWLTALVPAIGYLLSTLTMPVFKKWWIRSVYRK